MMSSSGISIIEVNGESRRNSTARDLKMALDIAKTIPSPFHIEEKAKDPVKAGSRFTSTHDAIEAMGSFGRYQIYTCFVLQYAAMVGAGIFALATFGQGYDDRECADSGWVEPPPNASHGERLCALSKCSNWTEPHNTFSSFAEEWSLVCDKSIYLQLIIVLLGLGRTVGFIVGGHIADYYGRKRALYASQFGVCVISTLSIACRSWEPYAVCAFLTGIVWGMGYTSAFVLTMESTDWRHRWIINACNQQWIQYAIVALIGWLTADWRLYLIIVNVFFAPLLIFFLLFRESPRYLIYHQKLDGAANVLSDIASDRWNNSNLTVTAEDLSGIANSRGVDPLYPTPIELFRHWSRAKITLTLMIGVLTASAVSNFFVHNTHPDVGNLFVNITIYGLAQSWVPFLIIFLDHKFHSISRRPTYLCFTIAVAFCTLVVFGLECTGYDQGVQRRIFALVGASLSEGGVLMCVMQIIVEIYPTAIRGIAFGWILAVSGIGGCGATVFRYLETHDWHIWEPLPYILLAFLAIISWLTGFLGLPETKYKPMQDGLNYCERRKGGENPVQKSKAHPYHY